MQTIFPDETLLNGQPLATNDKPDEKQSLYLCLLMPASVSAQTLYLDGRPNATKHVICTDAGVIMKHYDEPDSCDTYGAREAVVNRSRGDYYLFYDGAGKDGWRAWLAESTDLKVWKKKDAILPLGKPR